MQSVPLLFVLLKKEIQKKERDWTFRFLPLGKVNKWQQNEKFQFLEEAEDAFARAASVKIFLAFAAVYKIQRKWQFSPFHQFFKTSVNPFPNRCFFNIEKVISSLVISNVESLIYEAKSRYYLMAFHIVNIHREFGQRVHQKAIEKKKQCRGKRGENSSAHNCQNL